MNSRKGVSRREKCRSTPYPHPLAIAFPRKTSDTSGLPEVVGGLSEIVSTRWDDSCGILSRRFPSPPTDGARCPCDEERKE
ncbi:hypothetical protein CDAR_309751 [Caerostris darwini]|uniref:Uncharacterized protein n=1 Tax=Caerostris darwini TaxID=1538125 RepID=A0AAV4VWU2_9ARAC|nr:hypothetical protein CDAR_309751 [Caerostris darwini]